MSSKIFFLKYKKENFAIIIRNLAMSIAFEILNE